MDRVYLDHNATTAPDSRVREAMWPWLGELHGNPSSAHGVGQRAREGVEAARESVAALLATRPSQIVFTSSGTEANNTVVFGVTGGRTAGHAVLSAFEHPSIEVPMLGLEQRGWEVSRVPPEPSGRIDADRMLESVRADTALVCLMLANNEVGVLQPAAEVARGCRELGVPILCDAVQAIGKIAVEPEELGVDFLTLGAHKFYGPLGAAGLWVRRGGEIAALLEGGGQERKRRASTENVAAIAGMGKAAELAAAELTERAEQMAALRDAFEAEVRRWDRTRIHGDKAPRLPNTSNVAFLGAAADSLMVRLDLCGFAVSAGSACASGRVEPSGTLTAMGVAPEEAASSLRVSFGKDNRRKELSRFLTVLKDEVNTLRRRGEREGRVPA